MALASTGDLSKEEEDVQVGEEGSEIELLKTTVATLTKQNTKLKNELRFITETERWAGLLGLQSCVYMTAYCTEGHPEGILQTFREK